MSELISPQEAEKHLAVVPGWHSTGKEISRVFNFKNYYETMAFVNAIAYVAHKQDHHPDLEVSYNKCTVRYSSHEVGGLSHKDFTAAASVNALVLV
jgi:4a-hydroxytetrahydrobiopterin dehydratase